MWSERTVLGADVPLNLASGPDSGPPLLMLHGVTRCWQDYLGITGPLLQRWAVHALDFRGHGRSGRAGGNYLARDYAADVTRLLQTKFPRRAVLYGHSLGGLVALLTAAQAPQVVRALILEDPPGPEFLAQLERSPFHALFAGVKALAGKRLPLSELAERLGAVEMPAEGGTTYLREVRDAVTLRFSARFLQDLDPTVLDPFLEARLLEGIDWDATLKAVACPVLVLRADPTAGGMLFHSEAEKMARLIPDCLSIELKGVSHLIHWTEPEKTLRYTIPFLEALL